MLEQYEKLKESREEARTQLMLMSATLQQAADPAFAQVCAFAPLADVSVSAGRSSTDGPARCRRSMRAGWLPWAGTPGSSWGASSTCC